jgi:hypothetical protein
MGKFQLLLLQFNNNIRVFCIHEKFISILLIVKFYWKLLKWFWISRLLSKYLCRIRSKIYCNINNNGKGLLNWSIELSVSVLISCIFGKLIFKKSRQQKKNQLLKKQRYNYKFPETSCRDDPFNCCRSPITENRPNKK